MNAGEGPRARVLSRARTGGENLAAIPYLRGLSEDERQALGRTCMIQEADRGSVIFEEGGPPRGLFLILDGRVKLIRVSPRGREQVLHAEGRGATLGEVPIFDGRGYVATAIALEPCRLLFVPREPLLELCRRRPVVALEVIQVLARRLRAIAGLIEDLALRDVTARLARFLVDHGATSTNARVELLGTRDEVAARIGTVRELISRAFAGLRAAGAIHVTGRVVHIRNAARLVELAGGDDR